MTFGVPKTKEEIYQFLFGGSTIPTEPAVETPRPQVVIEEKPVTPENGGWRYVPSEQAGNL